MRIGPEPMLDLAARPGEPKKAFRTVHWVGAKSKGAVSALIEAARAFARGVDLSPGSQARRQSRTNGGLR